MEDICMKTICPKYITNSNGKKTAVILSIKAYQSLLEDMNDMAVIAERRKELSQSHSDVVKALKKDGLI